MATLHIDGRDYEAEAADNLLHACLSLGFDVPYFCWHPALGSVGACRQCAVKQYRDEKDEHGRLVMSCMTPAADGARISIEDPEAKAFRASVVEWLMTNHPHDCPVCEEGGECHLQDMTVMTGHAYRRYRFTKRTFRNQYLGPFVKHEMNRCIACYRCVRFYRDYAGGRDLDVYAAHNHVYFGRHADGVLESEFSGNLVEVCPTGVFTDRTLSARYTRKWDFQSAPSVCVHCGLGCNTLPNARYGEVRRILNRYHGEVNRYFLCDRGRYGYDFVNGPARIRAPLVASAASAASASSASEPTGLPGSLGSLGPQGPQGSSEPPGARATATAEPVSRRTALERAVALVRAGDAIGIGSPRASLESNFALRELVGGERFHLGTSDREGRLLAAMLDALRGGPASAATLHEAEESDAVLILGEDVPETAPRLALALRQMVRCAGFARAEKLKVPLWQDAAVRDTGRGIRSPIFIATPDATRLDELATEAIRAAPDDIARLGFAVAHAVDAAGPAIDRLDHRTRDATEPATDDPADRMRDATEPAVDDRDDRTWGAAEQTTGDLDDRSREAATRIAERLLGAGTSVIVAGASLGSEATIHAAAGIARALRHRGRDARLLFVTPECNSVGAALLGGAPLSAALDALRQGRAQTVVILENDLFRRVERGAVQAALSAARHVIALDHTINETVRHAELVLPAATFAEASGTLVSGEGRAQRFFQMVFPEDDVAASWRWLNDVARAAGRTEARWRTLDEVIAALGRAYPSLAAIRDAAPSATFRVAGERVSSAPPRESGRTAMHADRTVFEPKPPPEPDAPYTGSMEGYYGTMPGALYPFYWAPSWNSVQSLNKFQQEVGGPLRGGDPGVRLIEPEVSATAAASTAAKASAPAPAAPAAAPVPAPAPAAAPRNIGTHDADSLAIPPPFTRREGVWLIVPQYRVFGSDELSALAPAVAERITSPTLALHPEDAAALGAQEGDMLEIPLDPNSRVESRSVYRLPAALHPQLPRGVASLTVGLPGQPAFDLPSWLPIHRAAKERSA